MKFYTNDKHGAAVWPGDILFQYTGGSNIPGKEFKARIYEMHPEYAGAAGLVGVTYSTSGNRVEFWHAHIPSSVLLKKSALPPRFLSAFYRGMDRASSPIECESLEEFINTSDWEEKAEAIENSLQARGFNLSDFLSALRDEDKEKIKATHPRNWLTDEEITNGALSAIYIQIELMDWASRRWLNGE